MFSPFLKIAILLLAFGFWGVGLFNYVTKPSLPSNAADITGGELWRPLPIITQTTSDGTEEHVPEGATRFALVNATATFTIDEVLRGQPLTVVGTTKDVTGSVYLNVGDFANSTIGEMRIDARTLRTDDTRRDGAIARFILKSNEDANQFITFKPTVIAGLPATLEAGRKLSLVITGDLMISGIVKTATFVADDVVVTDTEIKARAGASIKRSDYNLNIPSIPFVADVPDEFSVRIEFTAAK
jgi:hypothetical protein